MRRANFPRWSAAAAWLLTACGGQAVIDNVGGQAAAATTSSGSGGAAEGGASSGGAGAGSDVCGACGGGLPETVGQLSGDALTETSGLVPSAVHAGAYYAHNDSGDSPRVFVIDTAGTELAELELSGAGAVDWEDADGGPCGADHCVYVGDIGDNDEIRQSYAVYRFVEPESIAGGTESVPFEELPFVYPDGSHNAEALVVDESGAVFVITKVGAGASSIYAFPAPLTPGQQVTLALVGTVTPNAGVPQITAATWGPQGLLVRTYSNLFFYSGDDVVAALAAKPCALPVGYELQGEAVAWAGDGLGYLTVGEGQGAPIYAKSCEP